MKAFMTHLQLSCEVGVEFKVFWCAAQCKRQNNQRVWMTPIRALLVKIRNRSQTLGRMLPTRQLHGNVMFKAPINLHTFNHCTKSEAEPEKERGRGREGRNEWQSLHNNNKAYRQRRDERIWIMIAQKGAGVRVHFFWPINWFLISLLHFLARPFAFCLLSWVTSGSTNSDNQSRPEARRQQPKNLISLWPKDY